LNLIEAAAKLAKADEAKDNETPDIDAELLAYINNMIEARRAAKKEKNFAEADRIRDELLSRGITLLDTREGTKFTIG
jgi:cysteinyl-tRNA synthetase